MATFDSNHPQNGDEIEADLLRNNFNALNDKIDAVPTGLTEGQLNAAINGTAKNADGVTALYQTLSDPPTQGEMQAIQDKLNELIQALRRNV